MTNAAAISSAPSRCKPTWSGCLRLAVVTAMLCCPGVDALAQAPAKPAVKPPPQTAAQRQAAVNRAVAQKRLPPPSTAAQRQALPEADEAQKAAAELVYYGKYICDDKFEIFVERDKISPGYVDVRYLKNIWTMKPVASDTGAVRLEDTKKATLLVQIPHKSMLLNTQTGQRIVDSCKSAEQVQALKDDAVGAPSSGSLMGDPPKQ